MFLIVRLLYRSDPITLRTLLFPTSVRLMCHISAPGTYFRSSNSAWTGTLRATDRESASGQRNKTSHRIRNVARNTLVRELRCVDADHNDILVAVLGGDLGNKLGLDLFVKLFVRNGDVRRWKPNQIVHAGAEGFG